MVEAIIVQHGHDVVVGGEAAQRSPQERSAGRLESKIPSMPGMSLNTVRAGVRVMRKRSIRVAARLQMTPISPCARTGCSRVRR